MILSIESALVYTCIAVGCLVSFLFLVFVVAIISQIGLLIILIIIEIVFIIYGHSVCGDLVVGVLLQVVKLLVVFLSVLFASIPLRACRELANIVQCLAKSLIELFATDSLYSLPARPATAAAKAAEA